MSDNKQYSKTEEDKKYELGIFLLPGVGRKLAKQLISYCGSAEKVFTQPPGKLQRIPGIGAKLTKILSSHKNEVLEKAEVELEHIQKSGAELLSYTDPGFPKRLRSLHDSPFLLFKRGNSSLNNDRCIAIVGTRRATRYGIDFTAELVRDLKGFSPLIVSGLAFGIDVAAHKAALKAGIPNVGVLAGGLNHIYPSSHKRVAHEITQNGALLSERTMNTQAESRSFPDRNRIIAGMADVVLVIEAARKGGALITAEIANTYEREVFALPGRIDSPSSQGCNHLIKVHKANLLTGIKDIEYILNWKRNDLLEESSPGQQDLFENLSFEEKEIMKLLREKKDRLMIDDIAIYTQLPVGQAASLLLSLEFKGLVKSLPGKMYMPV